MDTLLFAGRAFICSRWIARAGEWLEMFRKEKRLELVVGKKND